MWSVERRLFLHQSYLPILLLRSRLSIMKPDIYEYNMKHTTSTSRCMRTRMLCKLEHIYRVIFWKGINIEVWVFFNNNPIMMNNFNFYFILPYILLDIFISYLVCVTFVFRYRNVEIFILPVCFLIIALIKYTIQLVTYLI